jgi:hypothetical protein
MSAVAIVKNENNSSPIADEVDQSQPDFAENIIMPIGQFVFEGNLTNLQVAQSFIPTMEILTRVEIYIGKNVTTSYPIYISIRKELGKEDLTIENANPSTIPTGELGWVEIDLPDILVVPGHTYYIVAISENETDNWYGWGGHNDSESYPDGCAWFSYDEGDTWTNKSSVSSSQNSESFSNPVSTQFDEYITWDTCFKTYGRSSIPPDEPKINGPRTVRYNESQSYIITTNDPDGDDVYYQILWGDGTSEEWIGPYYSDEIITVDHAWEELGIFLIEVRAMDEYGYVGNWSEFEIEVPRTYQFNYNIVNWLLARFPMFRQIFGL